MMMMMEGLDMKSSSQKSLSNYRLVKTLGRGTFCKVKLAIHILTGLEVAIKIISLRSSSHPDFSIQKVRREINIMKLFTHPHIVRLYEVIETRSKIYAVMELMSSGDLFEHLTASGGLLEHTSRHFFQQIISGVEHCHLKKVVHRDLKPENILLDSNLNLKIADFGLSNFMLDGHFLNTSCGSPNYAAPEIISNHLYAGPEVDIWSCGIILFALLCCKLPFDDDNFPALYKKIKRGKYRVPDNLSIGAKDLISRMLVVNPVKRISIPEIRRHPWFQNNLPPYIHVRTTNQMFNLSNKINEHVVAETGKIGFNTEVVTESLEKKMQNEATVTYFLLLDKYFQNNKSNHMIELIQKSEVKLDTHHPDVFLRTSSSLSSSGKWAIGFKSRSLSPYGAMMDVLKVLEELNVRWKQIEHYKMKCIWVAPFLSCSTSRSVASSSSKWVKFEIQLYKSNEDHVYVLDIQQIYGPPFLFLEICSTFDALVAA